MIPLREFADRKGVCRGTLSRWRKKGLLKTVVIEGRHYVTAEVIAEFNERAAKGEFSGVILRPSRSGKAK